MIQKFIRRPVPQIRVSVGQVARFPNLAESQTYGVDKVIVHPLYVSIEHGDDIAIVRLQEQVEWNEMVQPICLCDIARLFTDEESAEEEDSHPSFPLNSEAIKNDTDENKESPFSNLPSSFWAALSRLFTSSGDQGHTFDFPVSFSSISERSSSDNNENSTGDSAKTISNGLVTSSEFNSKEFETFNGFHPRDISSGTSVNQADDDSTTPLSGIVATVVGWGYTEEKDKNGKRADVLQKVDVNILANEQCQLWYKEEAIKEKRKLVVIGDRRLCAGFEKGGKDSCAGDSGGPLIIKQKGNYKLLSV